MLWFLARHSKRAIAIAHPSVCLSVCLVSHRWIGQKRLVALWNLHNTVMYLSAVYRLRSCCRAFFRQGASNKGGWDREENKLYFRVKCINISKTVGDTFKVTTNNNPKLLQLRIFRKFRGFRRFGRQQQLNEKIDPYCQRQRCNPLNVLNIMFLTLICRRFFRKGPLYTPCCYALVCSFVY